jgi:hypothetical protein
MMRVKDNAMGPQMPVIATAIERIRLERRTEGRVERPPSLLEHWSVKLGEESHAFHVYYAIRDLVA